ncbi:MAG: hypothetical protein FWH51_04880 [Dehalococcoidia bacterium]|nr:hypothetical protein [Dehalococcoidia bacterium]
MLARKILTLAMGVVLSFASSIGGCTPKTFAPPPYIPPEYYDCIETNAVDLVNAYFAGYGEIWGPMERYNDLVFVFKDVLIDAWVVKDLDKGWIWMDLIKCHLADRETMNEYKIGDRIDVVGYNLGPENIKTKELTFTDCYVLPRGAIALPADGSNGLVVGGY